jgi:ADP-heptose:LPS heptosyltransferase
MVRNSDDRNLATEILQGFDGKAEVRSMNLIERIQTFRVLLANDTGTMHLADCLGIPLVAVLARPNHD